MADEEQTQTEDSKAKGGLPIKTAVVILVLLVLEGAAIVTIMSIMGKESEVSAVDLIENPDGPENILQELTVLQHKFSNGKQGRLWIWDMKIDISVSSLNADAVQEVLDRRASHIQAGIGRIVASAQHTFFQEPGYDTLRNQILDFLNDPELIGTDPEGEPMVKDVLIPSCIGFPADY